jgi:DNA-binding beta-propeller fold protein YncE
MLISNSARYALGVCAAVAILAGCGGGSPSSLSPSSGVIPEKHKDACSTVHTLGGRTYTVAHLGGGNRLDVESSAYANCDIGIYISPADGPARLNHSTINGVFKIGVYLDRAGTTKLNQDSICVNGTNQNLTCAFGSGKSTGTGLDAQSTPNLTVAKTYIDGYVAGLAASPCPNSANKITVNQSTVTRSAYPWSLQGGKISARQDDPPPPSGGSCTTSGSGSQWLYVANAGNSTVTAYDEQGNQQTLSGGFPGISYSAPAALTYDSNNQFLYVDTGQYSINAYDRNGNPQTLPQGAFPNLGGPQGMAFDPSDNLLYVGNYQYGSGVSGPWHYGGILVYDEMGNAQTLSGSFFGAYQTTGVAYDSNNGFIYNANYGCCGQALITVYDQNGILQTTSGSWSGLVPSGPFGIVYNPSNGFIYVSEGNQGTILAFDENGNPQTLSGSWTGLNTPSGITYDPNNGFIYVANHGCWRCGGDSITAYDNNGNQQTLSGSFPGLSYSISVIAVPAPTGHRPRKHHRASHPSMSTSGETTTP